MCAVGMRPIFTHASHLSLVEVLGQTVYFALQVKVYGRGVCG